MQKLHKCGYGSYEVNFSAGSSQTSEISRYHGSPEGLKMLSESKGCFVAFSTDAEIFQGGESLIIANLQ